MGDEIPKSKVKSQKSKDKQPAKKGIGNIQAIQ